MELSFKNFLLESDPYDYTTIGHHNNKNPVILWSWSPGNFRKHEIKPGFANKLGNNHEELGMENIYQGRYDMDTNKLSIKHNDRRTFQVNNVYPEDVPYELQRHLKTNFPDYIMPANKEI